MKEKGVPCQNDKGQQYPKAFANGLSQIAGFDASHSGAGEEAQDACLVYIGYRIVGRPPENHEQ